MNGGPSEPIRSLSYFEPVIAEVQSNPLPDGFPGYLRGQLRRLANSWKLSALDREEASYGGYPGMASPKIGEQQASCKPVLKRRSDKFTIGDAKGRDVKSVLVQNHFMRERAGMEKNRQSFPKPTSGLC
jgi:hypothetical protein